MVIFIVYEQNSPENGDSYQVQVQMREREKERGKEIRKETYKTPCQLSVVRKGNWKRKKRITREMDGVQRVGTQEKKNG